VARGLPLNRCSKLVVICTATYHPQIDCRLRRSAFNGGALASVTESEACKI
jgi:hypothetical protein